MGPKKHPRVVVYSTPLCPNCRVLKTWLKEQGIPFEERDLSETDVQAELILHNVFDTTTPILEVDGKFYSSARMFEGGTFRKDYLNSILAKPS